MEKKKWANPTLTKIVLVPEEAVLAFCKSTTVTASGATPGSKCTHAGGCLTIGS